MRHTQHQLFDTLLPGLDYFRVGPALISDVPLATTDFFGYVARVGVGVPVWKNIGVSVAYRVEGVPRYDLLGRSDGFRRPGREMYLEPGITFTAGRSTILGHSWTPWVK